MMATDHTELNESRLQRLIAGALKSTIAAHGPITLEWTGSGAKRVLSALKTELRLVYHEHLVVIGRLLDTKKFRDDARHYQRLSQRYEKAVTALMEMCRKAGLVKKGVSPFSFGEVQVKEDRKDIESRGQCKELVRGAKRLHPPVKRRGVITVLVSNGDKSQDEVFTLQPGEAIVVKTRKVKETKKKD